MKKLALLLFVALGMGSAVHGQQSAMATKYMFNPLAFNPAYAGSACGLDMVLHHRQQWVGIKGAPITENFSIHSPIKVKGIGLGLNASYDKIAVSNQVNLYGSFAYHIPWGKAGKNGHLEKGGGYVSIGLQGGVSNFTANWNNLNFDDPNDPAFQVAQPNLWLPNFGAGIYAYSKHWFVGFSAPMLINNNLRKRISTEDVNLPLAQQYRHYYLTGGGVIKLSSRLALRPSILIKSVGMYLERNKQNKVGAPTEFNVDLALLINKMFWVGASFRSAFELKNSSYDSVDFWFSMRLKQGIRFGFSYDFTLTQLQGPSFGSYEIMLGYDLCRMGIDNVEHNRYF